MNKVIISMDKGRNFRAYTTTATQLVEEIRRIHHTTPTASAALGRTLICTSLMGLMLKGKSDKLTAVIKGGGPAGQIIAISNSAGRVKGYIENPLVDVPLKKEGKLDVGKAVGIDGTLTVIKDLGLKEPYIGQMKLISGEIAEDFTGYFAYSEQQPSSVLLGVLVDIDYSIKAAGGCIVQIMPDADEEMISKLEKRLLSISSITSLIEQVQDPFELNTLIFQGFDMLTLDKRNITLLCDCSRGRMERALISLGKEELNKILKEDGQAELTCQFCLNRYNFNADSLKKIIKEAAM